MLTRRVAKVGPGVACVALILGLVVGACSSSSAQPSPCSKAVVTIDQPQNGDSISGVVTISGTVNLGCAQNNLWLFDHPTDTHSYYTAVQTPMPVTAGHWTRKNLCTGSGSKGDLGVQHQFVAAVLDSATSKKLEDQSRAAYAGGNPAFFVQEQEFPPSVAMVSATLTITKLVSDRHC
ncbi:hypothetical protein [Frankia sp. R82]|uniref:hypothetical protein n=1 Tax=Frankia sp. R82 TaxID=2950553 RepID=UPI00204330B7|nr:hypothetical protein [Frankia sp. R82]MCM3886656.1 hypothetical protein [Frankia sp. R82]